MEVCNSSIIDPPKKITLAGYLSLRIGLTRSLPKLQLSDQEKTIVEQYYKQEFQRFYLGPSYQTIDDLIACISKTTELALLQQLAFTFIGQHELGIIHKEQVQKLHQALTSFTPEIINIKQRMLQLIPLVIAKYQQQGFLNKLRSPEGFLTKFHCTNSYSYGDDDAEIEISHGGGFFYLCSFFMGEVNGYPLVDPLVPGDSFPKSGFGIQVTPEHKAERDQYYAERYSPQYLDQACVLTATISKKKLQKAINGYEAGLRTENRFFLRNITLTNLITKAVIQAPNYESLIKQLQTRMQVTSECEKTYDYQTDPLVQSFTNFGLG